MSNPHIIVHEGGEPLIEALQSWLQAQYPEVAWLVRSSEASPCRLILSVNGYLELLMVDQILRVEGSRNYSIFHLADRKPITVSRNLKCYEPLLAFPAFQRVHKSYIVNMARVLRFHRMEGGVLEMEDGARVPVSLSRKGNVLDCLFREALML